jgi:molybdopterin-containing oxidoreductase family membrane subunit
MVERSHLKTTKGWLLALAVSSCFLLLFFIALFVLFSRGVGVWGINQPVAWGFAIANFIWWVGIGHAGTFISAILFLADEKRRTAISRLAETMTIFAVICAGLFPLLHLGRPWFVYWLTPYYDTMNLWPQFRSPLIWDMFAVFTYLTISFLFWYLGLIPDFAIMRDHARLLWKKRAYGLFALGWRGTKEQWYYYRTLFLLLAALAAPLVISVHSIVGLDFAATVIPGWHSTIFPPYFVAGAIFSGFAMVITIGLVLRRVLKVEDVITDQHMELCAKFLLAMGLCVAYGYMIETFSAYYSGDVYEIGLVQNRFFGPYKYVAWTMIFCNVVSPQVLWFRRVRTSMRALFGLSLVVQLGMWLERFVIVATSLSRDFLPSSWHLFVPTKWDFATLFGSIGLFTTLYILAARVLPMISLAELKEEENEKRFAKRSAEAAP